MAAQTTTIDATFLAEKIRRENWIVGTAHVNGEVNERIEITGTLDDDDELIPNLPYSLRGHWGSYKNKSTGQTTKQFKFSSYSKAQPYDRAGVIAYLTDAGAGLGFGRARAAKLWELYESQAIQVLRETPDIAAAALTRAGLRLSLETAQQLAADLRSQVATESCRVHLTTILAGRGFRRDLPKWLIRDYGAAAADKLRENVFDTMCGKYTGCGFKLCDALWLHLKLPADSIIRQAYCVLHAIESEQEGSTWIARAAAEAALKGSIGSADVRPEEAIQYALDKGLISLCKTGGVNGPLVADDSPRGTITWLASRQNAENERELARMIVDAMAEPHCWPDVAEIQNIDGEQPTILRAALTGPIAILGGRPGTGKTFTAANVIKLLSARMGEDSIGIGAPTNLAAQRLSSVMAEYGVTVKARTNHSLLGRPEERGKEWRHHEANPLPFKVLVLDEESMKDTRLMCAMFKARAKGTMVLLIGDINQLPPVDRGAPLRDLIAAGLPYGELREIRRNSGGIVEACAAIAEGKPWGAGDNLEIIQVDDEEGQAAAVLDKVNECRAAGLDPVWDTRVIVAKNETRRALNKVLQGELNQNPPVSGTVFRVGDKTICRENIDYKLAGNPDYDNEEIEFNDSGDSVRISNGELGRVLEIAPDAKYMIVEVLCPSRTIRVPLGRIEEPEPEEIGGGGRDGIAKDKTGTGCAFDLAYAVTFHSSQGSQFPWAICVVSTRDGFMGYRELAYTGFSRAQKKCVAIGLKAVWDKFCRRVSLVKRKTFLKEMILAEQARRELAGM